MIRLSSPEWFKDAPCRGDDRTFFSGKPSKRKSAIAVCSGCSSVEKCLDFAIENNITIGVWGGKTGPELDRLVNS